MRTGKRKNRGKKTVLTRKVECLKYQCRKVILEFLRAVGLSPPRQTVKLVKLTEDDNHTTFASCLASRRKTNGGMYKPNVYKGYHSGLSFLFFRCGASKPPVFEDKVKMQWWELRGSSIEPISGGYSGSIHVRQRFRAAEMLASPYHKGIPLPRIPLSRELHSRDDYLPQWHSFLPFPILPRVTPATWNG